MEERKKSPLDRIEAAMRRIAAACLMGMALLTGADVFMRGAFNTPVFGSEEIVTILGIVVVGFALPYAHYQKSHIGVEILVRHFSRRTRRALGLLTTSATLFLVGIITWRMFLYGSTLAESGEVSMNLELPEYMVVYLLAFGFLVYTLCLAADIVKFLKGGEA
ncbi:TRAP transporter small permease [Pseudodesulfovibrio sp.]|uniref:TRAP transporter small permease n=1 Tax=Pseudodesulfovibrio sp. TaxID=2035812 RepID=UPI00261BCC4D|nr:TRAP transporter small permease [Pseudodesulfovibrio sp.]MDD3311539.1 TRAP transporter small permease [Pseudodesulfovibrio sp.]